MAKGELTVLHSVATYLNMSENWIYPQIVQVPGVIGRVLCDSIVNLEKFPIESNRLVVHPPLWKQGLGIPRVASALARRIGLGGNFLRYRVGLRKPDVLHAHFGTVGWECIALKRKLERPLVTSFYGYDAWQIPKLAPIWQKRYSELFEAGDLFLVEGHAMKDRLCKLGCSGEKVLIHHLSVDLHSLPFKDKDFRNGLKIIMVGRFVEKKGLVDGLRACALAKSNGTNLTITIAGDAAANDPAGQNIKAELHEIAAGPELAGCVSFSGFVPMQKVRELLKEHNVFLCPSRHAATGDAEGGSPVALTEAMAAGLLCIGSRHCDIPEVILNGKTGFLHAEGDTAGIASALQAAEGEESTTEICRAGRYHVERNYSLETQLNRIRSIYEELSYSSRNRAS